MRCPRLVFVLSPYQNAFFGELAEVLVAELIALSVRAVITSEPGDHVVEDDDVFILLPPHEYVTLEGSAFVEAPSVAARTIGLSAEQPHQTFFASNVAVGARLGAAMDFSRLAVERMRELGVDAAPLRFGYTPAWDRYDASRSVAERNGPPVLYLGNKRPRRLAVLSGAAEQLAAHRATLLVSDNEAPNRASGPTFVAGADKRDLLAETRLLLNIHQSDEPYFEWLRFAEAAHCGTPVLSERSIAGEPFCADVHYAIFDGDGLGAALDELVGDSQRLDALAAAAYEELRRHPLADGVGALVELATALLDTAPPDSLPARTRDAPIGRERREVPITRDPPRRPGRLWRRDVASDIEVIAPEGTVPLHPALDELVELFRAHLDDRSVAFATGVLAGHDVAGTPTLEGHWPWETWRLNAGQHLGRLLVTRRAVAEAALGAEPAGAARPQYLAIQWWAAERGMRGLHLPRPVARVIGEPIDPEQLSP